MFLQRGLIAIMAFKVRVLNIWNQRFGNNPIVQQGEIDITDQPNRQGFLNYLDNLEIAIVEMTEEAIRAYEALEALEQTRDRQAEYLGDPENPMNDDYPMNDF